MDVSGSRLASMRINLFSNDVDNMRIAWVTFDRNGRMEDDLSNFEYWKWIETRILYI